MVSGKAGYKARMLVALIVVFTLGATVVIAGVNEDFREAANRGDLPAVKDFIAKGADVNSKANTGETALMRASYTGRKEVVQLLLAKGADVNAATTENIILAIQLTTSLRTGTATGLSPGTHALSFAAHEGHKEVVQLLLAKGADVNAKDKKGKTALMWASREGHKEALQALLAKGADINAKDNDGDNALMYASYTGHKEVVQLLLAKGADVNAKDNYGKTALMLASQNEVKELLIRAGAK
jgi:ankyrin repeat protein